MASVLLLKYMRSCTAALFRLEIVRQRLGRLVMRDLLPAGSPGPEHRSCQGYVSEGLITVGEYD